MPKGRKAKGPETVKKPRETGTAPAVPSDLSAPKKPAAKKAAPRKKAAGQAMKETIILQSAGVEWNVAEIREKVMTSYLAEGHRRGWIKTLALYVKPEERRVYYVINEKITGSVEIESA